MYKMNTNRLLDIQQLYLHIHVCEGCQQIAKHSTRNHVCIQKLSTNYWTFKKKAYSLIIAHVEKVSKLLDIQQEIKSAFKNIKNILDSQQTNKFSVKEVNKLLSIGKEIKFAFKNIQNNWDSQETKNCIWEECQQTAEHSTRNYVCIQEEYQQIIVCSI